MRDGTGTGEGKHHRPVVTERRVRAPVAVCQPIIDEAHRPAALAHRQHARVQARRQHHVALRDRKFRVRVWIMKVPQHLSLLLDGRRLPRRVLARLPENFLHPQVWVHEQDVAVNPQHPGANRRGV
eukprot:scaffold124294_cov60-Phaeocystis_antarctica.AAC.5